jgi:AraC-like DNA-binding protein
MRSIPLIRVGILLPIIDFLNQIGTPSDRLLEKVNLHPSALDDSDNLITLYQGAALLEHAAAIEGQETLGFLIGRQTSVHQLGSLGKFLQHSLTLFDFLTTLEQTVGMINSGEHASLRWEGDWVWCQFHCDQPGQLNHLQTLRYDLGLYLHALHQVLGADWRPTEVHLEGPPCREMLKLDDFAGATIHFLKPYNAIKIPRAALSLPYNPTVTDTGLNSPPDYDVFLQTAPARTFPDSLHQLVQGMLPYGCPDITLVAEASGVSVRTLQRQLFEAGLTYSKLVDRVRFNRAVALLQQTDVKLIEIASDLAYTDPSNFARAFRRWTGVSPHKYRLLNQSANVINVSSG